MHGFVKPLFHIRAFQQNHQSDLSSIFKRNWHAWSCSWGYSCLHPNAVLSLKQFVRIFPYLNPLHWWVLNFAFIQLLLHYVSENWVMECALNKRANITAGRKVFRIWQSMRILKIRLFHFQNLSLFVHHLHKQMNGFFTTRFCLNSFKFLHFLLNYRSLISVFMPKNRASVLCKCCCSVVPTRQHSCVQ